MKITSLSKIEKLELIGTCIEAVTGIVGGSMVLVEGYPYATIVVLATGAVANKIVSFIKKRENKQLVAECENTPE